jgi:hypothetical protein
MRKTHRKLKRGEPNENDEERREQLTNKQEGKRDKVTVKRREGRK